MPKLLLSHRYHKATEKLLRKNPDLRKKLNKVYQLIVDDIYHPSLHLHKIAGENTWSIRVKDNLRIILIWQNETFYLIDIGNHDEVY